MQRMGNKVPNRMNRLASVKARAILHTCLGMKQRGSILIAFDSEGEKNARPLAEAAAKRKGFLVTEYRISKDNQDERPLEDLAAQMKENDVTVFCVNQRRIVTYGHSDARTLAVGEGKRVAFLTQDLVETPSSRDLKRIHLKSKRLGAILERTHRVALVTGKGRRRLDLALNGRKSFPLSSILVRAGDWGAVPDYAEAAISPIEEESEGEVEIDGAIMGYGSLKTPLVLHFKGGLLSSFEGKEFSKRLQEILENRHGSSSKILCELGLGANHLRKSIRGEFDDKKILGSAHIAIGDNHTIGGKNRADLHIDFLVRRPRILFDGRELDLRRV